MMNKTEIRVTIENEENKQRAIEILKKHGEQIWDFENAMNFDRFFKHLIFDDDEYIGWYINTSLNPTETEITIEQLDELLTQEKQK